MELLLIYLSFLGATLLGLAVKGRRALEFSTICAALIALAASIRIAVGVAASDAFALSAFFSVDALGAILLLIISCVGLAAAVYSVEYLRQESAKNIIGSARVKQYYVLLNLFLAAMFLAVSSSSPIFAWIAIEATTLSTAFLVSFYNKPSSMEAAWKYLIINSVGLLLGFFGTLLYLTSLPADGLIDWSSLLAHAAELDPVIAKVAFIFVLVGYGTKVGLAPMHTWLPDAHGKAPAPISALLSGVLLNVALIVILRFRVVTDAVVGPAFSQTLLIAFGLGSIAISALIIFTQKNYKRLLAYSSVENMGLTTLGFGLGGVGALAAILHLIFHALLKSALFLLAGNFLLKYNSAKLSNVKGAMNVVPVTSVLFLAGFFALTGAPPFGIFLTKILIFSTAIMAHPVVAAAALFLTALVFIGFFKHATAMIFGETSPDVKREKESAWLIWPPLTLLALVLLLSFYQPAFLKSLINTAAVFSVL